MVGACSATGRVRREPRRATAGRPERTDLSGYWLAARRQSASSTFSSVTNLGSSTT